MGWYVELIQEFNEDTEFYAKQFVYNKSMSYYTGDHLIWNKFKEPEAVRTELINMAISQGNDLIL